MLYQLLLLKPCGWRHNTKGHCHPRASSAQTRGFHTQLDEGPDYLYWVTTTRLSLLFSHLIVSDSLRPHELHHTRLCYPSPSPGACSNSCPLTSWCHPTVSSSVIPFSSCLQSFPELGSFPMSLFSAPGGQSIADSASASVLPMNIQGWFPLGLTGLISLQSSGLSRVFSNTTLQKHQFFGAQPSLWSNSHIHN